MNPTEFLSDLQERFSIRYMRGEIKPAPQDIDCWISIEHVSSLKQWLGKHPMVEYFEPKPGVIFVYYFHEKQIFLFDIEFSFTYLTTFYPFEFDELIEDNPIIFSDQKILRTLRYFLLQRSKEKYLNHLQKNRDYLTTYLPTSVFRTKKITSQNIEGFCRRSIISAFNILRFDAFLYYVYKKFFNKLRMLNSGIIIAVCGPDGVGKTSLLEILKSAGICKEISYMGDTNYQWSDLYSSMKRYGMPITYLIYPLQYLEQCLRYWQIFKTKIRGGVVLTDRYPTINHVSDRDLSKILGRRLIYFLFPNPDIYILLKTQPEVIYERKQELSINQIQTNIKNLEQVLRSKNHTIITNDDMTKGLQRLVKVILQYRNN